MNVFSLEFGNEDISAGRDIPWLQDTDADSDGVSDNWLTSWPFVYRDVVIVDADNVAVDAFNLTLHSLEEPDSYATFRQMLIDVAVGAINPQDDVVSIYPGETADIDVLSNDEGLGRLELTSVIISGTASAEVITVEHPADLDSIEPIVPELILSEIVPGEYIELYNSLFSDVDLRSVDQVIVSGNESVAVADLASDLTAGHQIASRGYLQLPWPEPMTASSEFGEFVLFRDSDTGFDDPLKIDDFVGWGTGVANSRLAMAEAVGKWWGPLDGALDEGAIQRIPGTLGDESHAYDNHRPSTPGNAINDAIEQQQIVRYQASEIGSEVLTYTVEDYKGTTSVAQLTVHTKEDAYPWLNLSNKFDVNNDGVLNPLDALEVINFLNMGIRGTLPVSLTAPLIPAPFVDCNGDNIVSPLDALLVINELSRESSATAVTTDAAIQELIAEDDLNDDLKDHLSPQQLALGAESLPESVTTDTPLPMWYRQQTITSTTSPQAASPQAVDLSLLSLNFEESPLQSVSL